MCISIGMFEIGAMSLQSFDTPNKMWLTDFIYNFTNVVFVYFYPGKKKIRQLEPREIIVDPGPPRTKRRIKQVNAFFDEIEYTRR